jgi:hypothetical protein
MSRTGAIGVARGRVAPGRFPFPVAVGHGEAMRRWVIPVALILVPAVLADVVAVFLLARWTGRDDDALVTPEAPPLSGTTTTVPPAPGSSSAVEAVVRQLQGFVERERGLPFKAPVKVSFLDEARFRARVTETDKEDREEVEKAQAVLQAMGLLAPGTDLLRTVQSFVGDAVVGLYDTETKELLLRGAQPSPGVRLTLVHELTHALDDQHFNLHRENLGDEADLGFSALVEGSAIRVEERYLRSLSSAERAKAREEEQAIGSVPSGVPQVVRVALGFPYVYGPKVVSAVLDAGGNARLNAAVTDPRASTEQALDPKRYLGGDKPRPVAVPRADRPAFDDGEIGQLFLVLMLRAEIDGDDALDAAKGWGGDRYVAWRDGTRTCVRMDFVMDTAEDTGELAEALGKWAAERPGGAVARGTSLTTCG